MNAHNKGSVVHVITDLDMGGAQKCVLNLILNEREYIGKIIVLNDRKNVLLNDIISNGIEVVVVRPFSAKKVLGAIKMIRGARLLHVHLFPVLYLLAFSSKPKIFTEHSTWNRRRRYSIIRWLERWVYKRYDKIVAISPEAAQALKHWTDSDSSRIQTIYNGIELDKFRYDDRKMPEGRVVIAMVGRFTMQKDQDCLVRALALLPPRYELAFAGEGERLSVVRALVRSEMLESRVRFLGNIVDIPGFLKSADIYVQSSHWEGFGLAAVEAMASALPTLGTDVSGLSSVIGNSCYLFQEGNHSELAKKIELICGTRNEYRAASGYALRRAQQFGISETVAEYEKVYASVVNKYSG